jgi:hypothetical protein
MFKDRNITNLFLTLDIETRIINNVITPYLICFYDGENEHSFYLNDFSNVNDMIKSCLKSLISSKYNNHLVYVHNLSLFDGVFLLGSLSELVDNENDIQILKRDNKIILIKFKIEGMDEYIEFRDSLLLLPISLSKLSKTFNKENEQKDIFPYEFTNTCDLNYVGEVPDIKYFDNLTASEYSDYIKRFSKNKWSLKDESIKYCNKDCISLYNVIKNFNQIFFDKFHMNIHKYPTLSSLSIGTFRTKYLNTKKTKIPIISGTIYKEIKKGYTGGSTDLFIPYGENVSIYDINSLFPFCMATKPMPIGKYYRFEGDIRLIEDKPFGFFEVIVHAPIQEHIQHPIIQTRVKTNTGVRTVSPLGT